MVSCSFHSPPGVLFTFPSRYYFTIGHSGIFSLTRWSSWIHTGFHGSHTTRDKTKGFKVKLLDFHRLRYNIQLFHFFLYLSFFSVFPTTPIKIYWFRLFPFRSPLLWKSLLLSIPPATKMFQFAGLLPFSIMNLREGTMRLPYSGISESMFVLNSSELFAVAHALHHL